MRPGVAPLRRAPAAAGALPADAREGVPAGSGRLGSRPAVAHLARQLIRGARRYTFLSSEKAGRELGYASRPLEETVRDTLRWFLEHGDLEATTPELRALRGS
jgi:dihydroflavonol-4-reductase